MSLKISILISSIFLLISETVIAKDDCVVPGSVIPPNWCKFPSGVSDPTAPKFEHGLVSGNYAIHLDDRVFSFLTPQNSENEWPSYSPAISTRSREALDWLRVRGEYDVVVFGLGWNFHWLGIPILGTEGYMNIDGRLYVKTSPANRANQYTSLDKGDFSKPEELRENMERGRGDKSHTTPIEEVVINNRKWYHYLQNSQLYPDYLNEYYVTGLASDRYLKISITLYPTPFTESRYPTYPPESQRPWWMKKAFKYKQQVISSLRITPPEGNKQLDEYEVDSLAIIKK